MVIFFLRNINTPVLPSSFSHQFFFFLLFFETYFFIIYLIIYIIYILYIYIFILLLHTNRTIYNYYYYYILSFIVFFSMAPKTATPFEEFLPWAIRPLAKRIFRPNNNNNKKSQTTRDINPFFKFFAPFPRKESQDVPKKEFYKFSKLEDISVEYLLLICKDFTPYELFSLAGTCKRLRNLLMSDEPAVQSIWRNSRLQHMRYLQLPPPYLLTEQEYIGLTMMERGCQFCGQRKNWVRVHWRFQVRSCYECYKPRYLR
jgi:hypothetical protein